QQLRMFPVRARSGIAADRRAMVMADAKPEKDRDLPARVPQGEAEVEILGVEAEALVERPGRRDRFDGGTADAERRAGDPFDLSGLAEGTRATIRREATEQRGEAAREPEQPKVARGGAAAPLRPAVGIGQRGAGSSEFQVLGERGAERGEAPGLDLGISVEQQEQ